jgi:hypothetical protein
MGNASLPVKSLPVEKRRGSTAALGNNQGGGSYNLMHALIAQLPVITSKCTDPLEGQDPDDACVYAGVNPRAYSRGTVD